MDEKSSANTRSHADYPAGSNSGIKRQIVNGQGICYTDCSISQDLEHTENTQPRPRYYHPCTSPDWPGVVASLDNLRLKLLVPKKDHERLAAKLDAAGGFGADYYTSNRCGTYRCLWTYETEPEVSFTVGLGLNRPNGKIDWSTGFLDFNPNKTAESPRLIEVMHVLLGWGCSFVVKRLDLAIDYEKPRNMLTLLKDRRRYDFVSDKAATEYLGKRSNVGRVKLYDKLSEMGYEPEQLKGWAVSRLELTTTLSLIEVMRLWPRVLDSSKVSNLTGKDYAFLTALLDLVQLEQPIEKYLSLCKPWTARRYRKLLEPDTLEAPTDLIVQVLRQAEQWQRLGCLAE